VPEAAPTPDGRREPPAGFGLWFGLLLTAAAGLIGLRYLLAYGVPASAAAAAYALSATLGHMALLAFAPIVLIYLPCRLLPPLRRLARPAAVFAAAALLTLLVLDSNLFARHGFHLGVLTAALFETRTWALAGLLWVVFLGLAAVLAAHAARLAARPGARRSGRLWVALLGSSLVASHLGYAWADARYDGRVTAYGRYLPAYYPLTAKRFLARHGLVDPAAAREASLLHRARGGGDGVLDYPLAPLRCEPRRPLPNVIMIVLDGLRFDAVDPRYTPSLNAFANDALLFERHYSGGNSTRMGMFSLFYGMPGSYFESVYASQTPAVLMGRFEEAGYDFGIFAAYSLSSPAHLDRTAFARIPGLVGQPDYPNEGDASRDAALVETWFDFLDRRRGDAPLFGYLHFDPPITNLPPGTPLPPGLDDVALEASAGVRARRELLEYRRRLFFVDGLVGNVLTDLERRGLDQNTLVIVTGDHGEEYDDSGQDLWGHGTGYSDYQIRTPLMLRWPGRAPDRLRHRTSHYDVAPTLLQEVFGCANPPSDFAIGRNLFAGEDWDYLPIRSYFNRAIVTPESVIVTYPGGIYEVRDRAYRPTGSLRLDRGAVEATLAAQQRFYR
jgi:membrane-anchored protein YejM (alkaline phosphatase superfamily)